MDLDDFFDAGGEEEGEGGVEEGCINDRAVGVEDGGGGGEFGGDEGGGTDEGWWGREEGV